MLIYDHARTKNIVERLVSLGNALRLPIITFFVVLIGVILAHFAEELVDDAWWLGGIFGTLIGFGIGMYASIMVSIGIEWMAQSLVAQGEILAALKDNPTRQS